MYPNGVSHLTVDNDKEGVSAILDWLSFVPKVSKSTKGFHTHLSSHHLTPYIYIHTTGQVLSSRHHGQPHRFP